LYGGNPKKQVKKERVIKRTVGAKQEVTEISTVQEDGKPTQTTVTIIKQEVKVTEILTKDRKPKKKVTKKHVSSRKQLETIDN
jgi:hypothetical protein